VKPTTAAWQTMPAFLLNVAGTGGNAISCTTDTSGESLSAIFFTANTVPRAFAASSVIVLVMPPAN